MYAGSMLRGYVLRYLATIAIGGSTEGGAAVVPAPLRGLVQRAAQQHVIAAGFDTTHAADVPHVYAMAYLRAIAIPTIDSNDVEGVRRTFLQHRREAAEDRASVRVAIVVVGVLLLLAGAAGAWWLSARPGDEPAAVQEGDVAPTLEELLGMDEPGEPAHPLAPLFERRLPDYTVALDRRSARDERAAPEDVASRRSAVLAEIEGTDMAPAMTSLLDAAEGYVDAEDPAFDDAHWLNQLILFHDALAQHDVPFYVDASLTMDGRTGRHRVLLSTWNVHRRRTFRAGDLRVRALDITRLDSLNFERSLLGYTRPESRYALIVRDRIERFLVEDVLPSVHAAADSVIVRGYQDETGTAWVTDFEQWAHEDLRRESQAIVAREMPNEVPLTRLAAAIVRRRNAVAAVSASLGDVRLREPLAYDYDIDDLSDLTRSADRGAVREVRLAEEALHRDEVARAYRILLDARSLSVAEHEVQHRLDYESDRLVTVPEALSRYTGETGELEGVNLRAERANAELSAYLSQIARRPALAWTSLIHVASFLMSRPSWRMPEAYAAVALFESIATEAGIEHTSLIAGREIVRAEASRIYGELRSLGAEELSRLAGRTWARLYGSELPELVLEG